MSEVTLTFVEVRNGKGFYANLDHRPDKLNLSGALALFAPSYEELELLKQDLIENMQWSISEIKRKNPADFLMQDEFDAWYREEFGIGRKWMPEEQFLVFMQVRKDLQKLQIEQAIAEPKRAIRRIVQRQQHLMKPAAKQGGVTEAEIEQAREYPLEDLIDKRIFKAGGKWRANCHCPLVGHEGEKTPSFYIDKNNRYKCFGCHGSGDSIDFVMQRDGVKFIQAVKSLL